MKMYEIFKKLNNNIYNKIPSPNHNWTGLS